MERTLLLGLQQDVFLILCISKAAHVPRHRNDDLLLRTPASPSYSQCRNAHNVLDTMVE